MVVNSIPDFLPLHAFRDVDRQAAVRINHPSLSAIIIIVIVVVVVRTRVACPGVSVRRV